MLDARAGVADIRETTGETEEREGSQEEESQEQPGIKTSLHRDACRSRAGLFPWNAIENPVEYLHERPELNRACVSIVVHGLGGLAPCNGQGGARQIGVGNRKRIGERHEA